MAVITVRAKDLTVAPIWATPYLDDVWFFSIFNISKLMDFTPSTDPFP